MTNNAPPIETTWDGFRFRSRTEARWAVALTYWDVKWEYEKEGYDINGEWYLPDFWLPSIDPTCAAAGWGQWLEIKPNRELTDEQSALYDATAKITGHRMLVACGHPWDCTIYAFQHHHAGPPVSVPRFSDGFIAHNPNVSRASIVSAEQSVVLPFLFDVDRNKFNTGIAASKAERFDVRPLSNYAIGVAARSLPLRAADMLQGESDEAYLARIVTAKRCELGIK